MQSKHRGSEIGPRLPSPAPPYQHWNQHQKGADSQGHLCGLAGVPSFLLAQATPLMPLMHPCLPFPYRAWPGVHVLSTAPVACDTSEGPSKQDRPSPWPVVLLP